jgi:transglutaminase-like putative cysteine protease
MRLQLARKTAAHATVGFAFASMATGGDIPGPVTASFVGLLLLSFLWGERIGRGRSWLFAALSGGSFFVLLWLARTGAIDTVVAASLFAASLAVNRLFARQSAADDGLLYLAALMMLAGGAALSAELFYGLCFVGFTVCSTQALTLSHLARAAEEARVSGQRTDALAGARLLRGIALLSLAALLGSAAVFFLFPRLTAGLAVRAHMPGRSPTIGFSDTVSLGGHGVLKGDSRVAMRISVSPLAGRERLDLLWRGRTFDRYDGRSWRSSPVPARLAGRLELRRGKESVGGDVAYEVEILPAAGTSMVFLTGAPLGLEQPRRIPRADGAPPLVFSLDRSGDAEMVPTPEEGYAYVLRARAGDLEQGLKGRGDLYPEEIEALYLDLPGDLDPRIRALAQEWTAGKSDPYTRVKAIERELLGGYRYTTRLPGDVADPLAHFLFERKEGHCEFFSTALAVLSRAVGVPARNATGFYGGRLIAGGGYYLVRAGDAHSWTEAYFPGRGFVPFDATPPSGRQAQGSPLVELFSATLDRAAVRWRALVVEYTLQDQLRTASAALAAVSRAFDRLGSRRGDEVGAPLSVVVGVLVAVVSLVAARRFLWQWRPRRARGEKEREVVAIYRVLLRRLSKRGLRKRGSQTPREFARTLAAQGRNEARAVAAITERYLVARFGGKEPSEEELARMRRAVADV